MDNMHITGVVEKLVFGGDGLIRQNGLVVFVPGVVPGEEVVVEEVVRKKNFARAHLCKVVRASPYRIEPKCRHFGVCGGCQLQHIAYEKHAEIKRGWLEEAFFCIYRGKIDFYPAEEIYFWRRKITLHAAVHNGKWILGYFGRDNTTLVAIEECPLFFTDTAILSFLKGLLFFLPGDEGACVDIELMREPSEKIALCVKGSFSIATDFQDKLIDALRKGSVFSKISMQFGSWRHFQGGFSDSIAFSALGQECYFSLGAFVQNHAMQGEKLWRDIVATQGQQPQTIFDLYSGVGVTALALANVGHKVYAVEGNEDAVLCGKKASKHMIRKPIFVCDSVERALTRIGSADSWILNPPRTGLSPRVLELVVKEKPQSITYVSCSPATLVRDLKVVVKNGWEIVSVRGYDMFPQTTHLETIALLSRSK